MLHHKFILDLNPQESLLKSYIISVIDVLRLGANSKILYRLIVLILYISDRDTTRVWTRRGRQDLNRGLLVCDRDPN